MNKKKVMNVERQATSGRKNAMHTFFNRVNEVHVQWNT